MKLIQTNDYLLLIDEKVEIKGTVCLCYNSIKSTWDEDIILYQGAMPEYHYKGFQKIIAYYPLNSEAEELDLPWLPPFEELDVEKLAYAKYPVSPQKRKVFLEGYKAAQSKQFTLEDMKKAIEMAREDYHIMGYQVLLYSTADEIIQSLSTQQLPKEFIPEIDDEVLNSKWGYGSACISKIKTITNSEGKEVLVGTYKY